MSQNGWPGKWHSLVEGESGSEITNDEGLLFMTGQNKHQYLWFETDGYDHRTEIRR